MRTSSVVLAFTLSVSLMSACTGDPNDPMTWAKQLKNLRTQKEALDHLANMDVDKARPAVPYLIELFKDTKRPEHLEALARYLDPQTKQIMIEALDYTEDDFDRATIAAGVLGDMKDPEVNPKLWTNMDDFKAKAAKLQTDAETAMAAPPADPAAVGALLKSLGADCGAGHQAYRIKKD